jgi:hypothetical protein
MPETLLTPTEWMRIKHPNMDVYDPDGWRGPNGRPWGDAISEAEFDLRYLECTIGPRRRAYH